MKYKTPYAQINELVSDLASFLVLFSFKIISSS